MAKLLKGKTIWMPRSPVSKLSLIIAILASPYIMLRFFWKAWRLSKQNTLVYMHSLLEKIFMAPCLRFFNIPYIFVEHATIGNWLYKNPLLSFYKRNLAYKRAKLITVSHLMAADLKEFKPVVIANAINQKFISSKPRNNPKKILYIGRLTPDKGVDQIVRSALDLQQYQFVFIGNGPLAKQIKHAGFKLYQKMSHRKILEYLKKVDLLLLPSSKKDPFGLTVLEAMSREIPSLISSKVGIKDYLKHKDSTFIIKNNLTDSIAEVFSEVEIYNKVKNNLEKHYRSFGYQYMATSYFKIFQKL